MLIKKLDSELVDFLDNQYIPLLEKYLSDRGIEDQRMDVALHLLYVLEKRSGFFVQINLLSET